MTCRLVVKLVEVGVDVVLQEDLDMLVHLSVNVFAEERGDKTNHAEGDGHKSHRADAFLLSMLVCALNSGEHRWAVPLPCKICGADKGEHLRDCRFRETSCHCCCRNEFDDVFLCRLCEDSGVNGSPN